jgi:HSP20 family protein
MNRNNRISRFDNFFDDIFNGLTRQNRNDYRIVEYDDRYEIGFDVPGIDREDVSVEVTKDNVLRVQMSDSTEKESGNEGTVIRGKSQVSRSWSIRLQPSMEADSISASLDRGVLTVSVPKSGQDEEVTKKIEVE